MINNTHYNLIDTLRVANPELWAEMYQKIEGCWTGDGIEARVEKILYQQFKDRLTHAVIYTYVELIVWSLQNEKYGRPAF